MQPDIGIAVLLRDQRGQQFIGGGRLGITEVGRAEQPDRAAGIGLDQPLRAVQLDPRTFGRDQRQIGMSEAVIADLATFINDPVEQKRVRHGVLADHEERGRHMLGL